MFTRKRPLVAFTVLGAIVPWAGAQHHGEEKHGEEHGKPVQFTMPTTYKAGVEEIEHRLHEISELIEAKKLDKVHAEADVIQKVAKVIGQLALKADSGVPKDSVKEVNLAGKDLAAKFDAIDKAGDSGDLTATKKIYEEMVAATTALEKYVPKVYQCPMKCEGEKVYDKPGKCPKCGMDLNRLKEHADHEAKHGGAFFMAPDQSHHLEGTLSASGEFRIYFYDNFTKPISAEKFSARASARPQGADKTAEKPMTVSLEPGKGFLTGKVDPGLKFPIAISAYVDFKDGQKPQLFDFDFSEPSKDLAAGNGGAPGHDGD